MAHHQRDEGGDDVGHDGRPEGEGEVARGAGRSTRPAAATTPTAVPCPGHVLAARLTTVAPGCDTCPCEFRARVPPRAAVRARPVTGHLRTAPGGRVARQRRARAGRGGTGVPALLGGRAPRLPRGGLGARRAHRRGRRRDGHPARGSGRDHAAQPLPAAGRRDVPRARGLHPGRIDLGLGRAPARTGAPRWRCAGRDRPWRPTTSTSSTPSCADTSRASPPGTRSRASPPCRRGCRCRRCGCWAPATTGPASPPHWGRGTPTRGTSGSSTRPSRCAPTGRPSSRPPRDRRRTPSCPSPPSWRPTPAGPRSWPAPPRSRPCGCASGRRRHCPPRRRPRAPVDPGRAERRGPARGPPARRTAQDVAGRLARLARRTGADELLVVTNVHDQAERAASYELLAQAWPAAWAAARAA